MEPLWQFLTRERRMACGDNRVVIPGVKMRSIGSDFCTHENPVAELATKHGCRLAVASLVTLEDVWKRTPTAGGAQVVAEERTALWLWNASDLIAQFERRADADLLDGLPVRWTAAAQQWLEFRRRLRSGASYFAETDTRRVSYKTWALWPMEMNPRIVEEFTSGLLAAKDAGLGQFAPNS